VLTSQAFSQQINFSCIASGKSVILKYQWKDNQERVSDDTVIIPRKTAEIALSEFRAFETLDLSTKRIIDSKMPEILAPYGCWPVANEKGDLLIAGPNVQSMQLAGDAIIKERERVVNDIYSSNYYRLNEKGEVEVDYAAIVNRYVPVMHIVAESIFTTTGDKRSAVAHYLDFIRTIPYSYDFSNHANFQTPLGMLLENKGDCDTKAVAFATLMKSFGLPVILIGLPNHMIVGIELEPTKEDYAVRYKGKTYILSETSSDSYKLGQVSEHSYQPIEKQDYSVIEP